MFRTAYALAIVASAFFHAQAQPPVPSVTHTEVVTPYAEVMPPAVKQVVLGPGQYVCPDCGQVHTRTTTTSAGGLQPGEINRNDAAYRWAKREADFYAAGNPYPGRWRGHRYGPGGFGSRGGTGVTTRPNNPNHCYDNRPTSEIVARAVSKGTWRGRPAYFWSAILR